VKGGLKGVVKIMGAHYPHEVVPGHPDAKCTICKKPAKWVSADFHANICSGKCLDVMVDEYSKSGA
jgi:hypothetical protein